MPFSPNQMLHAIESADRNTAINAVVTSDSHDIEIMIFQQVNEERKKFKINLLRMDSALSTIARQHSIDMANNCSLTHSTLGRRSPSLQSDQQGTTRKREQPFVAAENIGMMPVGNVLGYGLVSSAKDVADAMMNRWMKSTSHQVNILSKDYKFIGVGVAYDGSGAYYLTQNFK
ncbi:MAG: CAP domain-containing protein [Dissulfurispiraceae bacterium]